MKQGSGDFSAPPRAEALLRGRVVSPTTMMVPNSHLGVGEMPSILHLIGYSEKCSLADELEIVEEEGATGMYLL